MLKRCMTCRKEYTLTPKDPQYKKFLLKPDSLYICRICGQSMQNDAQSITGLNPDMIDQHDKYVR
ncbi:hypothetical protein [Peribacillus kribbensis]|uniref:hypothetical protein n=1 Tax=Peribacillus kribbensis TaxID=356658 RepID=UPI00047EE25B|nr:hypothetical protein [Peribacillus kribbensis]